MLRRALFALPLLTVTAMAAPPGGDVAFVRAALTKVPVSKRDNTPERRDQQATNLDVFAREIARVAERAPLDAKVWAALMVAQGSVETNFDTEVVAGRCLGFQCDPKLVKGQRVHQAVGAFQQHEVSYVRDLWATAGGNIAAQVEMADRTLRRSLGRCKPFAPFPNHVFRAYYGGSCSFAVAREPERVAAYRRALATVVKGDAS